MLLNMAKVTDKLKNVFGNATELVAWIDQLAELLLFMVEDRAKLPEMSWLSASKKLVDESTSTEVAIRRRTKKVDKEALIAQRLLETKKKTRSKFGTTPLGTHDYVPFPGDDDIPATRVKEEKVKTKESDMTYKYYVRDLGIGNATELVAWIDQLAELLLFVEDRAKHFW